MQLHRRTFLKQLGFGTAALVSTSWPSTSFAETVGATLPSSTPEKQGVSSEGILAFLDAIAKSKHEFHSFMVTRHGHVVAEGWWTPYRPTANHMLYSLSKSFTSTAVGFAVSEGRLKVTDKVVSFFPDKVPATMSDNLANLEVRHLLTMSVGHAVDSTGLINKEDDWVKAFLALPIANAPGSTFLYNSGATYMCSAIVQKLVGRKIIDYLTPRLFEPLRIEGITWETCPLGTNTGGWGLSVPTEALAKFGQFYLQRGKWNRRQLLLAAWIDEATSFKIQQPPPKGQELEEAKKTSDWLQGYCYQFWRCRHNAFRGDGAFGQFDIIMPDQDAVVSITCETGNMQTELNLVWDYLLPAMRDGALPKNKTAEAELRERLAALKLPRAHGEMLSKKLDEIHGKTFKIESNKGGVQDVSFKFRWDACEFYLTDNDGFYSVTCGFAKWIDGISEIPGSPQKITVGDLRPLKVAATAGWRDENTLEMLWRFYETPHSTRVICKFNGGKVNLEFIAGAAERSSDNPKPYLELQGSTT